jgi:hypothetical protein
MARGPNLRQMKAKVLLLISLFSLTPINSSNAADCEIACVDVYTQDGQLIFEARKGSGPKATAVPKPVTKPKVVAKPRPVTKPKAVVRPKAVAVPKVAPPKKKRVVKKSAPVAVVVTSLSDRLSKSLPTTGISYQPNYQPLINVPVYFWNDMPSEFRSKVDLIGEVIDVTMRPSFTWAFGDGTFKSTTDSGAPFPNGKITHIYSNPGIYPVVLVTTWGGTFTHNGIARAITGEIRKVTALTITVVAASTRFTN